MTFTEPPDYDKVERLEDYLGQYAILEPIDKMYDVRTIHGTAGSCWDIALWTLNGRELELHTGIRVFNKKLVQRLDVAKNTGAPIAGLLQPGGDNRNDPKIMVINDGSANMEMLAQLWRREKVTDTAQDDEAPF